MLADAAAGSKVDPMSAEWDCVVVGGGAAGLSAALVMGRARRRTLVVDAGRQSNLAAPGIGGLLGNDGTPPAELYATGRAELAKYPTVVVRRGEVVDGAADGGGFVLELGDGSRLRCRKVVLATGMDYRSPAVSGLADGWGSWAFHCPFCHGWEMRDQPLAVLAGGDRAVHMALMLRAWTDDVIVLTDGTAGFDAGQQDRLAAAGIGVDERAIAEMRSEVDRLVSVEFEDGASVARSGVLVATTLSQRSRLAQRLGVAFAAPGPLSEDAVEVDPFHRTSVPGVFAAGDVCAQMPQVAAAVASGSLTGAAVVQSLLADDVGLPMSPWPIEKENVNVDA
jgi:thioredoxin reductase